MKLTSLRASPVHAIDGPVGQVADLRIDSRRWMVRALAVRLDSATVLVDLDRCVHPRPGDRLFRVSAWRHDLRARTPRVSGAWDASGCIAGHLIGCSVAAVDGKCGRVTDVVIDERWRVLGLAVESHGWLSQPAALLAPEGIDYIDFAERFVYSRLTRRQIWRAPHCASADLRLPADPG